MVLILLEKENHCVVEENTDLQENTVVYLWSQCYLINLPNTALLLCECMTEQLRMTQLPKLIIPKQLYKSTEPCTLPL